VCRGQTTDLLVPRRPFSRLVREVCQEVGGADKRWKASALEALQEVAEAFVVEMLMDGKEAAEHAKRWVGMAQQLSTVLPVVQTMDALHSSH
jgi:histone H3/H4